MKATELIAKIEAYAPRDLAWERDQLGSNLVIQIKRFIQ